LGGGAGGEVRILLETSPAAAAPLAGEWTELSVRVRFLEAGRVFLVAGIGGREETALSFPVSFEEAGDSIRCRLPFMTPFVDEEGESLVIEAREDSAQGPLVGRLAAPFGPTTPGIPLHAALDPGEPEALDARWPFVLFSGEDSARVFDAKTGAEILACARPARSASLGPGFCLYEAGGRIYRVDLGTGESTLESDPRIPSTGPVAGDSFSLWFRSCCGTRGELFVRPEEGAARSIPLLAPPSGPPSVSGSRAAWLETDGETWTVRGADLVSLERESLFVAADSVLPPTIGADGVAFAARLDSTWAVLFRPPGGGSPDTLAVGLRAVRDVSSGAGVVVWREKRFAEWDVRGVLLADGRDLPVCLASGDQGPLAFRDSTAVWIDRRRPVPEVRGLRLRPPPASLPSVRFRFESVRVSAARVLLEWSVEGEIGACGFEARRAGEAGTDEGVIVARGEIPGPGYYSCEDRSFPEEGGRQRVRYFLSLELPGGALRFGPVAVELPERFGRLLLTPQSPNPSTGDVRFGLEIPPGWEGEEADLLVFDPGGRCVREVSGGRMRAGLGSLVWDRRDEGGNEVGAGVYFLRFRLGRAHHETRKVILLPRGG
jgi:hypothetical protein